MTSAKLKVDSAETVAVLRDVTKRFEEVRGLRRKLADLNRANSEGA